jgi:hypothetical protein
VGVSVMRGLLITRRLWHARRRRLAPGGAPDECVRATLLGMLDHAMLSSVAEQMISGPEVVINGRKSRVTRTGAQRLRTVRFLMGGREYQAIEQNPEKPSRWGKLAREGRRVVQVRDLGSQKYVAAVVDGRVIEYSR